MTDKPKAGESGDGGKRIGGVVKTENVKGIVEGGLQFGSGDKVQGTAKLMHHGGEAISDIGKKIEGNLGKANFGDKKSVVGV